jgi:hypothetical protein
MLSIESLLNGAKGSILTAFYGDSKTLTRNAKGFAASKDPSQTSTFDGTNGASNR